jgi:ABC-type antimicrobial peptide transport system permease subunit
MALGAAPRSVMNLVLSRVFILIKFGVVIGALMSLWASRFVATLLLWPRAKRPRHTYCISRRVGLCRDSRRLAARVARVADRSGGGASRELRLWTIVAFQPSANG